MQKMLAIDPEKCTGCRLCEVACSLHHESVCAPDLARIRVTKWESEGIYIPMVCQQCDVPICEAVCPMNAIRKNHDTGALIIESELCVGCRLCVQFCPFGGVTINEVAGKIVKCDLCNGAPVCVGFCEPEALKFLDATKLNLVKRRTAAEKFSDFLKRMLTTS